MVMIEWIYSNVLPPSIGTIIVKLTTKAQERER
jgi:hypothetical protein